MKCEAEHTRTCWSGRTPLMTLVPTARCSTFDTNRRTTGSDTCVAFVRNAPRSPSTLSTLDRGSHCWYGWCGCCCEGELVRIVAAVIVASVPPL